MSQTWEEFQRAFAKLRSEERQAVADFANAQLQLEEARLIDPWAHVIERPADAADIENLNEILQLAKGQGIEPKPENLDAFAQILAAGGSIRKPSDSEEQVA